MATTESREELARRYEESAQAYARRLSGEPLGETRAQGRQREITLESLAVLKVSRPDVHVFNDLAVHYFLPVRRNPNEVVPDQLVVLCDEPVEPNTAYELAKERARPFWVLDYVCEANQRKDYDDNFDKYERDLKVPYYLIFYPDNQELTLYRHIPCAAMNEAFPCSWRSAILSVGKIPVPPRSVMDGTYSNSALGARTSDRRL